MLLIFTPGRLDVFPANDLGVKKGIQGVYSLKDLPDRREMERLSENCRPHRTVASLYLWRHKDSPK